MVQPNTVKVCLEVDIPVFPRPPQLIQTLSIERPLPAYTRHCKLERSRTDSP